MKKELRCSSFSVTALFRGDHIVVDRLAAAQQIHIRIGADLSKEIGSFLGMLFLNVLTIVNGDVFLVIVPDLLSQSLHTVNTTHNHKWQS